MKEDFLDTLMEIRSRLSILESESDDDSYKQGIKDASSVIFDVIKEYL
jgi:hypothetical protein